jgi:signal transduction histidine kinase
MLALYITAILGPALVLLYLGIQAVQRQREAIDQLAQANRQLQERTLAAALELRLIAEAGLCLRDAAAVLGKPEWPVDWSEPGRARDLRVAFEGIARRHGLAKAAFFMEDGVVRVPRTQLALPLGLTERLADTTDQALAGVFEDAAALERSGRLRDALRLYTSLHARATHPAAAAGASVRIARTYERMGQLRRAADIHRRVMEEYADVYDASGRPHGLVAAVEWQRLSGRHSDIGPAAAWRNVRQAFASGRWELDPDAADYFAAELSVPGPDVAAAPYLDLMPIARLLTGTFQPVVGLDTGTPQRVSLAAPASGDIFYLAQRTPAGIVTAVGFVVDIAHVRERLLRQAAQDAGLAPDDVRLEDAGARGTRLRETLPRTAAVLVARPDAAAQRGDLLIFAGTVGVVVMVLLLGVVLLLRDVRRDAATSRLRSDLVGGVSHELKTPLTAIRMYGETLAARPDAPEDVRRTFYEVIVQESDRLTRLVDRVLDFSRLVSSPHQYDLAAVRLLPLLEAVVSQYEPFLRQQGFAFEFLAPPHAQDIEIQADREAVARALVNLMDNAVKYSEDDRWIRVSLTVDALEARVTVEDHGVGICPGDRQRIFERFSRGSSSVGRGGYGLGLYLVRHVMQAHGGRIEVTSGVPAGSQFALVFPIVAAAVAGEPA